MFAAVSATPVPAIPSVELPGPDLMPVVESLARGEGPGNGQPLACTSSGAGTASCSDPNVAGSAASVRWNNESGALLAGRAPPAGEEASLAYDAFDGYFLFFGGCLAGACPSAETWIYQQGLWSNWTGVVGSPPPARYAAAMTYDPNYQAVVLFGGCSTATCPLGDSWSYRSQSWTDLTGTTGICTGACPSASWGSSLAWDPPANASVLYGGCTDSNCLSTTARYALLAGPGVGWEVQSGTSPPGRSFPSMAYDPALAGLLLTGGGYVCSLSSLCVRNDTWSYTAAAGWSDRTTSVGPVPGRAAALLAWDNTSGTMLLFGGYTQSTGALSDSWSFGCSGSTCSWSRVADNGSAPARFGMAWSSGALGYAPWFVGGLNESSSPSSDQWAWGAGPTSVSIAIDPEPTTVSFPTWYNASVVGGAPPLTASWYWSSFDRTYPGIGLNAQFSAPVGTYPVDVTAIDAVGLLVAGTASVTVTPGPNATVVGPGEADVGVAAAFTASVANDTGLAPFGYAWTFSDGTTASGAVVQHAFDSVGGANATVVVTDRASHTAPASLLLAVHPAPAVALRVDRSSIDPTMAVHLNATGTNGTAPYTVRWSFGDGSSGATGPSPAHRYDLPGTYTVEAMLTDAVGGSANGTLTVVVSPFLNATLAASIPTGAPGVAVGLTVTVNGGTAPYRYAWDFGDGSTTANGSAHEEHAYGASGGYLVSVTVTDALGTPATTSLNLTVASGEGVTAPAAPLGTGVIAAIGAALAIAAVGGWLLWRRRPRRRSPIVVSAP